MDLKTQLSKKIKPFEHQKKFSRMFVLHPLHVGAFAFAILLQASGMIADELRQVSHGANLVWVTSRHAVYLTVLYFAQPYLLRYFALNRIPFVLLLVFHYSLYVTVYMLIFGPYVSQFTHVPTPIRAANNILIGLPFIVALAGIFGRRAALSVFDDAAYYPTWKRYYPSRPTLQEHLSEQLGAIRYIKAQHPCTEVTMAEKTVMLDLSLKEAVKQMPKDMGWRVHRSWWVAKSEVEMLKYVDGNPNVGLKGGETIPISRQAVAEIKAYLALQDASKNATDVL